MILLDRMLLRSFFKAWLVCFFSLVSLYLVIDLFNKLDEFFDAAKATEAPLWQVIASYYTYQLVLIFDRLCGVIVLLAAMFTITWLQRNNELLPLLSAGVPTRRVLRPIAVGTLIMVALNWANREFLIPQVAEELQNPASDPRGEGVLVVNGAYEPNFILITGAQAVRQSLLVRNFTCTVPERVAGALTTIRAQEARYVPRQEGVPLSGGWLLTEAETSPPLSLTSHQWRDNVLEVLDPGKYFLRTERVDFDMVTRTRSWYTYASVWDIVGEMERTEGGRLAPLAVQIHLRLTLPILTFIMVLMGLAIILRDQCRNVFLNAGMCLIMAAAFYASCYLAKYLGEHEYLSPTLAAWLPVFGFGPLALAMADAIHT
jgi:lipopolysaccharide export system permease protein